MDIFIKIVKKTSEICGVIATFLLLLSVLAIVHMVVERYVFNLSTVWQTEFVIFSLAGATFIGSPYILLKKGHVNVEIIPHYLGKRGKFICALIASLTSFLFCLIISYVAFQYWHKSYTGDWKTGTVWDAKIWKLMISFPIGMTLTSLQYIADILSLLTGREMPFQNPNTGEAH